MEIKFTSGQHGARRTRLLSARAREFLPPGPLLSRSQYRLAPLLLLVFATCSDSPTAPSPAQLRSLQAIVAGDDIKPRFLFLPPLGPKVRLNGVFDRSLKPEVEICEWSAGGCIGALVARLTTNPGPEQIHVFGRNSAGDGDGERSEGRNHGDGSRAEGDGEEPDNDGNDDGEDGDGFYGVRWNPRQSTVVGGKVYRLTVLVAGAELGHVDVLFTVNGRGDPNDEEAGDTGAPASPTGIVTAKKSKILPIAFWIEKPRQRLTIELGRGVTGSLAAVDSMFQFGSRVSYSFRAMDGFENVQVTLDGRQVSRSGRVVADTTHVLYATADRIVTLTPELQPLYAMAHGILSAADPVAATQAYLDQAYEYVRTHDADQALEALRDVHYLAFDQPSDSAAVRRLDAALANHTFEVRGENAVAPPLAIAGTSNFIATTGLRSQLSLGASSSDGGEQTVFAYVNGIWTTQGEQYDTFLRFRAFTDEIVRFRDSRIFRFRTFYNRTRSEQIPPEASCLKGFLALVNYGIKGLNSAPGYLALCMGAQTYRQWSAADLVESTRQAINILARAGGFEEDAKLLASAIQGWRDAGNHVILLPHSQGNLMAIQAIRYLRTVTEQYNPARDSTCIGAVSLASPLSHGWELPEHYLGSVVVSGDPVPNLIPLGNSWPRIPTDSSAAIKSLGIYPLPHAMRLHSVESSYLTVQARDSLKVRMNEVYDACAIDRIDLRPFSATLRLGETQLLIASLLNKYGDTLFGRQIDWTSTNDGIASVSRSGMTNGRIGGVAPGTAWVTATNHGASSAVPVTVLQPPLEIFPSTYTVALPAGFGGDQSCSDTGDTPDPASIMTLRFFRNQGDRALVFHESEGESVLIASIYEELFNPSGVAIRSGVIFRLFWNADRTQLSGTVDHPFFRCRVGWSSRIDPITFTRVGS